MEFQKLFINDKEFELLNDGQFARTLQVNDLVSLDNRQTNFTKNIKIPKTPKNVINMDFLGVVGNNSNLPYQKNTVKYLIENEMLIYNGWGVVNETNDFYNVTVYDGNLDFYKAIENTTLGDLNLTEIEHSKTLTNVVNSFTAGLPYKYILADYNGKTKYYQSATTVGNTINIDYLVPSVKVSWLWNQLFNQYGFSYSGSVFSTSDFTNLWLTYPKGLPSVGTTIFSSTTLNDNVTNASPANNIVTMVVNSYTVLNTLTLSADSKTFTATDNINGILYLTNNYDLTVLTELGDTYTPYGRIIVNGIYSNQFLCDGSSKMTTTSFTEVSGGTFQIQLVILFQNSTDTMNTFGSGFQSCVIKKTGETDYVEELKGFKSKDFLNEIIWRFGLTPIKDKYTNNYYFKTLAELTKNASVLDWSDKFQSVEGEKYLYGNYAQTNNLRYKYNDENARYNDGAIYVNNKNLDETKTIIQSNIYSPESIFSNQLGFATNTYKLWDKEVKDDGTVNYKQLQNRFHLIRSIDKSLGSTLIGSESLAVNQTITTAPVESFSGLKFNEIVDSYYPDLTRVLDKAKILNVKLKLSYKDVSDFDFSKLYFFKQLGNYYIINKIVNYQLNQTTNVELIKVDYSI